MKHILLAISLLITLSACKDRDDPFKNATDNLYKSLSTVERSLTRDVSCGIEEKKIKGGENVMLCKFSVGGEAYVNRVRMEKWCSVKKDAACFESDAIQNDLPKS